jgi:NADH dehydrogenase FAD-containing subunit
MTSRARPLVSRRNFLAGSAAASAPGAAAKSFERQQPLAVNRYLQSWDVPNVFVFGASAFPQNAGYNPTDTVAALAYWSLDRIKSKYLPAPGKLM